jgi:hypothetical protein
MLSVSFCDSIASLFDAVTLCEWGFSMQLNSIYAARELKSPVRGLKKITYSWKIWNCHRRLKLFYMICLRTRHLKAMRPSINGFNACCMHPLVHFLLYKLDIVTNNVGFTRQKNAPTYVDSTKRCPIRRAVAPTQGTPNFALDLDPRLVWVLFEHCQRTTVIWCTFKRRTMLRAQLLDLLSQQLTCWVNNSTVESTTQQPDGIDTVAAQSSCKIKQCLAHSSIPISYYLTNYMISRVSTSTKQEHGHKRESQLGTSSKDRSDDLILILWRKKSMW